jgi:hypothetical protein
VPSTPTATAHDAVLDLELGWSAWRVRRTRLFVRESAADETLSLPDDPFSAAREARLNAEQPGSRQPGSQQPRSQPRGARASRSGEAIPEWVEPVVALMDTAFVIPGTRIRIGLDPILGLILPGAGDALTALVGAGLVWVAFKQRVPSMILLRMVLNLVIDALIGMIPFVGDIFDIGFRAGVRNYALLQRYAGDAAAKPRPGDYAVVALALVCTLALLALPILMALGLFELMKKLFAAGT